MNSGQYTDQTISDEANIALLDGRFEDAIRLYFQRSHLDANDPYLFNILLARRRYRVRRALELPRTVVIECDEAVTERSVALAEVAEGEIIAVGPRIVPGALTTIVAANGQNLPPRTMAYVLENPVDIVRLTMPCAAAAIVGLAYHVAWGAQIVWDLGPEVEALNFDDAEPFGPLAGQWSALACADAQYLRLFSVATSMTEVVAKRVGATRIDISATSLPALPPVPQPALDTLLGGTENEALERFGGIGIFAGHAQTPAGSSLGQPANEASYLVDIVVAVYNALEDVKACVASLKQTQTTCRFRVILVNDGSDQDTTIWLRKAATEPHPDHMALVLLEHATNRGYTQAVNTGLRHSTAPYVVTLNSDTIVTDGWLEGLIRCIESAPEIGICGPLSNAASWQNVPDLYGPDKVFAINALPEGMTPNDMAIVVGRASKHSYPRTTFVNGFCFMLTRAVLDTVGYMDEEAFPVGYGEENDFCIRAQDAGFALAYADDTYVFHAKSKSFGSERRTELSKAGGAALREKHGIEKFTDLVRQVGITDAMDAVRSRVRTELAAFAAKRVLETSTARLTQSVAFSKKGYHQQYDFSQPVIFTSYAAPKRPVDFSKIELGIHLHLHYPELVEEFCDWLGNVPAPFKLYVSVTNPADIAKVHGVFSEKLKRASVDVKSFPNKGRDIGPFIAGFGKEMLAHEYICHIHGKRSPHNIAKRDWRSQLLTHLMGTQGVASDNLRLLTENEHIGMIFPEYHWSLEQQISWGTNFRACESLAEKLDLAISPDSLVPFPAGSMFFARKAALEKLLRFGLTFDDFPEENAQIDGTIAHAVERLFGELVIDSGFEIQQVRCTRAHDLLNYFTANFPYVGKPVGDLTANVRAYTRTQTNKTTSNPIGLLCANAGGYDPIVLHEFLDGDVDYHYHSDTDIQDFGFWKKHDLDMTDGPTMAARMVKARSAQLLRDYEIGIWMDANVMIRRSLKRYVDMARHNPEVPVFGIPHPHRVCIYDEAIAVIEHGKADEKKVRAQINGYAAEGYPKKHGLIETNFLVFNNRHPLTEKIFEAWEHEIRTKSHRDQLSFNYVLWKLGATWLPLMEDGYSLRNVPDFAYFGHGRNSGYVAPVIHP